MFKKAGAILTTKNGKTGANLKESKQKKAFFVSSVRILSIEDPSFGLNNSPKAPLAAMNKIEAPTVAPTKEKSAPGDAPNRQPPIVVKIKAPGIESAVDKTYTPIKIKMDR